AVLVAQIQAVERTDHIAVALAETARDPGRDRLAERDVERRETLVIIVAADTDPPPAVEHAELRLARAHQDRAADRVTTEQGALRTAKHFDPGNVAEIDRPADRAAKIDFVEIDADARVDRRSRIDLADAANEDHRGGAVPRKLAGGL